MSKGRLEFGSFEREAKEWAKDLECGDISAVSYALKTSEGLGLDVALCKLRYGVISQCPSTVEGATEYANNVTRSLDVLCCELRGTSEVVTLETIGTIGRALEYVTSNKPRYVAHVAPYVRQVVAARPHELVRQLNVFYKRHRSLDKHELAMDAVMRAHKLKYFSSDFDQVLQQGGLVPSLLTSIEHLTRIEQNIPREALSEHLEDRRFLDAFQCGFIDFGKTGVSASTFPSSYLINGEPGFRERQDRIYDQLKPILKRMRTNDNFTVSDCCDGLTDWIVQGMQEYGFPFVPTSPDGSVPRNAARHVALILAACLESERHPSKFHTGKDGLIVKSRASWIALQEEHGIDGQFAEDATTYSVFTRDGGRSGTVGRYQEHEDLRDASFISMPSPNLLALSPIVTLTNDHVVRAIELTDRILRARSHGNQAYSEKGFVYEQQERDRWGNLLPGSVYPESVELGHKRSKEQVDLIFLFDDVLFVAEIKSRLQPHEVRDKFRFALQMRIDVEQALKKARCCEEEACLREVRQLFHKKEPWKPRRIKGMLLYSCDLGWSAEVNGIRVATADDAREFFEGARSHDRGYQGGRVPEGQTAMFDGRPFPYTAEGFDDWIARKTTMRSLNSPAMLRRYREFLP